MAEESESRVVFEGPDHVVLAPSQRLLRQATVPGPPGPDLEAIARAESALEELSASFANWMDEEVHTLLRRRDAAEAAGWSAEALADLFHSAHDIKGQAATFGFPRAGEIAGSLCCLLDHMPDPAAVPPELIGQHVDAIRAVVRETASDAGNATAATLAQRLDEVTQELIARHTTGTDADASADGDAGGRTS